MKLKRRTFLKVSTLSALSNFFLPTAFAGRRRKEKEEPLWVPKVGRYANTICNGCLSGCGIRVKRVEKNAVKIEGNPDFPMNQGGVCPRGQAALQSLYNPDRIKTPLKRAGERGSDRWEEISWDSALNEVTSRLQGLRQKGRSHTLALLTGRRGEGTPFLFKRFMESYGSPNFIWCPSLADESVIKADHLIDGSEGYKAYNFTNTQYVISFGDVLLQSPDCYMHLLNSFKRLRFDRPGRRAKLVSVDSRFSTTAAKADEWVPVKPGTEGALALGIAYILIKEDLLNSSFVEKHAFGFEDWQDDLGEKHVGFKNMVLNEYSPDQVLSITGVAPEVTARLARESAGNLPAVAVCSHSACFYSNGVYNAMAFQSLNALLGSINTAEGIFHQRKPPVTDFPIPEADETGKKGLAMPRIDGAGSSISPFTFNAAGNFPQAVLSQNPYPADILMIYHCNPVFKRVDSESFKKAFAKIPFIINFSPFMDETALYSDLVLPDSTFLERWESTAVSSGIGRAAFGIRQPVVEPLYDTLNTGDVIIRLADKIGKPVSEAFPWKDSQQFVKERVRGIQESGRGSVVSTYSKKFWKKLLEKGGWWETDYDFNQSDKKFNTPSGKFEFFSQTMRKNFKNKAPQKVNITARGDQKFMPHYEAPEFNGDKENFPLILIPFPTASLGTGGGANQPFLQEIFGAVHALTGESWVEINPDLAVRLNIRDKSHVWIESRRGRIETLVKIFPGPQSDVIYMPLGQGHTAFGRYADKRGVNPLSVMEKAFDPVSGAQVLAGTRVRIYKA